MNKKIATTVKVEETLYDDFKVLGVRHKLTLQGLVEKSIYLYVNDHSVRELINGFILPITSGAEFPQTSLTSSLFEFPTN